MASKGDQTRAQIVASARQLFYEHGFDGASFSSIVDATGLLRGNIYHYFKSKDDLLLAVVESRLAEFGELLRQWEAAHPEPCQRLLAFTGMITGRSGDLVQYGCPIGTLNSELGKDRKDLQDVARSLFDLFRDWLAAQFAALGHPQPAQAALHLLGRAQGVALLGHVYRDEDLLTREIGELRRWIGEQCAAAGDNPR